MKDNITDRYKKSTVIPLIDDIYDMITWGEFAQAFFPEHSVSWFYNKMRGVDGNGGAGTFTEEELAQLSQGLTQLSEQIRAAAARIASASSPAAASPRKKRMVA